MFILWTSAHFPFVSRISVVVKYESYSLSQIRLTIASCHFRFNIKKVRYLNHFRESVKEINTTVIYETEINNFRGSPPPTCFHSFIYEVSLSFNYLSAYQYSRDIAALRARRLFALRGKNTILLINEAHNIRIQQNYSDYTLVGNFSLYFGIELILGWQLFSIVFALKIRYQCI